jgi:thiaminase
VEKITRNCGINYQKLWKKLPETVEKITRNYEWKKLPGTCGKNYQKLWKKLPETVEKLPETMSGKNYQKL